MARGNQAIRTAELRLTDPDPRVRANAVEALWQSRQRGAEHVLRKATRDSHPRVVVNGWVGLYYIGDPGAAEGLLQLASDGSPAHRAAAVWGLGQLGDAVFQPKLQALVRDPDAAVRRNALKALVKIRKRHHEQLLTSGDAPADQDL